MLHVYFGTDTIAIRTRAFAQAEKEAQAGRVVQKIEAEQYQPGLLGELVGATSLFGETACYVLDTPSSHADFYEAVLAGLSLLAEAEPTFVIIEGPLLADQKKQFAKHASTMEEHKASPATKSNPFALADALARRDKKSLWILLVQASQAGARAEETIGILWWQLKMLLLAQKTKSASEAGVNDFPYKKAKQALSKFKQGEIEALALSLLTLYHDAHAGKRDMDVALERWVLSV